ncbi:hypothetical protein ACFYXQ_08955 [Nocardia jiangxiensis]|uniref:Ankyrin repeat-containing protein n=1 Tax=Nocardia jiangxiensis TaxID=282685 RepID=A0ABW6RV55_9NOCA
MIAVLVVLVVLLPILIYGAGRAGWRQRSVNRILSAAETDDMELLGNSMRKKTVNRTTVQGDSALHLAYYANERNAIENLRAYGADEHLRNKLGLTPRDMAALAVTESQLQQCIRYLDRDGYWRSSKEAYGVYLQLRETPPRIFNPAVVREVLEACHRRELLILAIKVGKTGSQEKLAEALDAFGNKPMAEDYLNAGSPFLREAAQRWAQSHNYRIFTTPGGPRVVWGQF